MFVVIFFFFASIAEVMTFFIYFLSGSYLQIPCTVSVTLDSITDTHQYLINN